MINIVWFYFILGLYKHIIEKKNCNQNSKEYKVSTIAK